MPDRDPQRAYEESLNRAVALYKEPYDDSDGERANSLPSLRAVAEEMGTSIIRARKLLITAGMYTSVTSRWVQELLENGWSMEDIMEETGLGKASVYSHIPYNLRAFSLEESSLNADRQKKTRERARAAKVLKACMAGDYKGGSEDWRDRFWNLVCLFEGYRFMTEKGKRFTCKLVDGTVMIGDTVLVREDLEEGAEGEYSKAIRKKFGL